MLDEQPARVGDQDEGSDPRPEPGRGPATGAGSARAAGRGRNGEAEHRAEPERRRANTQRHRAPRRRPVPRTTEESRAHDATGPPSEGLRRIGPHVPEDDRFEPAQVDPEREPTSDAAVGQQWYDHEAGPVVRPYTVTGGRARPVTGTLDLLSYVEALFAPDADVVHLQPEHRSILDLTRTALSVAEIAAHLDLPVGVVRVLIGDLVQANLVSTFSSPTPVNPPDESILQAVIDGLRAL